MEFVAYNANPRQRKTGDCVVRALSLALNKSWETVYRELLEVALETNYSIGSKDTIKIYLERQDIHMEKMPKRADNTRYTVREFCDELAKPKKTYLLLVAHHLTCARNKNLYDTWNCSRKSVGNYWKVN